MKKKRIKIKRLSLETWMKEDLLDEGLIGIDPVFNKNGYYFKDEAVWFEVNKRAYLYDIDTFKFALGLLQHQRIRDIDFLALSSLVQTGFKCKEVSSLYRHELYARETRKRKVEMHFWFNGMRRLTTSKD